MIELPDDRQVSGAGGGVQGGEATLVLGVDGQAEGEPQPDGGEVSVASGRLQRAGLVAGAGVGGQEAAGLRFIGAQTGDAEALLRGQRRGWGPVRDQEVGDRGVPLQEGVLQVGALVVVVATVGGGAVFQQQRHPGGETLLDRLAEQVAQDGRPVLGAPVRGHGGGQPARDQQLDPGIVRAEVGVVQALRLVEVGARIQQQGGERAAVRVGRLRDRATFPLAHGAGQRAEPTFGDDRVAAGIRPAREQQPGSGERIAGWSRQADAAVAQRQERGPAARASGRPGQSRIGVQQGAHARDVAGGSRRVDGGAGDLRVARDQALRFLPSRGCIFPVVAEAGEIDETIRRPDGVALRGAAAGFLGHGACKLSGPFPGGGAFCCGACGGAGRAGG